LGDSRRNKGIQSLIIGATFCADCVDRSFGYLSPAFDLRSSESLSSYATTL